MNRKEPITQTALACLVLVGWVLVCLGAAEAGGSGVRETAGEEIVAGQNAGATVRRPLPFGIGEKLVFEISWYGIAAGVSELTVKQKTLYRGREVYRLVSRTTSAGVVGKLLTVDNRLESFIDAKGLFPYYALLRQREGKRKKDKDVYFDQDNGLVSYVTNGGRPRVLSAPPAVLDILSSLYYFRTLDLKVGASIPLKVFSLKHNFDVAVNVLRKEKMKVLSTEKEVYVLKPHITLNGTTNPYRKGDAEIWLTADEKRLPVKIRTRIRLGHVDAVLIGYAE